MIYIYNAGALFSAADIKQRRYEGECFSEALKAYKGDYFIANPIDLPFDNTRVLTSKEIFMEDYKHVNAANVFFFDLAGNDTGTMVELGNAIEKKMNGKDLKIYPIFSDLRMTRNDASKTESCLGFNSYVVGCLTANNINIFYSFEDALKQFKKDFNLQ